MRSLRPARRTVVRVLLRSTALAGAVTLTVALSGGAAKSSFSAVSGTGGSRVTASADFCTTTGTTLTPSEDTSVNEAAPTTTYGTYGDLGVVSQSNSNVRALLRFSLPSLPTSCTLTGATLRLYANTVTANRTLQVHRIDPATPWTASGTTWFTRPAVVTATAVEIPSRSTAGWDQWTVTSIVSSLYAGTNSGFMVRDKTEGAASERQYYDSMEKTNKPQLVLTWS